MNPGTLKLLLAAAILELITQIGSAAVLVESAHLVSHNTDYAALKSTTLPQELQDLIKRADCVCCKKDNGGQGGQRGGPRDQPGHGGTPPPMSGGSPPPKTGGNPSGKPCCPGPDCPGQ